MKLSVTFLIGCALVASAANRHKHASTSAPSVTSDQSFVTLVAQTDMAEANLGQLAEQNGDSQGVKDFAQMMVTDHTADYTKIGAIGAKAGLQVPNALDEQHIRASAPLRKLKGAAFDRQYAQMMLKGHEAAIAAYDKEARDGQNADLKAYAQATLPTLEKHRDAAKALVGAKSSGKSKA